jgi:hypothetical protein
MILAGPHDRLPSGPTAAPAQPAGFPRLFHFPASHQRRTGCHRHPANPQRRGSRRSSATPAHRGNRNVQPRLPEIDTARTLIARSSTGSVGPGERIGQRGGAGEHQQTLADRAQQNTCSVCAASQAGRLGLPHLGGYLKPIWEKPWWSGVFASETCR